jgi:hypothetical protein
MIDGKHFSFWACFSNSKITSPETPESWKELMQRLSLPYFDSNQETPLYNKHD